MWTSKVRKIAKKPLMTILDSNIFEAFQVAFGKMIKTAHRRSRAYPVTLETVDHRGFTGSKPGEREKEPSAPRFVSQQKGLPKHFCRALGMKPQVEGGNHGSVGVENLYQNLSTNGEG